MTAALRLNFQRKRRHAERGERYNTTEEIITGDAYDFRPAATSVNPFLYGFDLNQRQYRRIVVGLW
jgi:hypothetical protein